ncbi:polymorphic toxin-type HINT domain-containing protein [Actinoplanes sp. CA-252034]|uniref:polymorphic toxin-type HINT domain-containing protein n=1 Tax=Actinoplanes sp. CA-252034 TaxID=3239906 RepID=UPI003D996EF2
MRRRLAIAVGATLALFAPLVYPGSPALAVDVLEYRDTAVEDLIDGGPSVRRAAEAALVGSDNAVREYVDSGRAAAQAADERAAAQVLAGMDGPAMHNAAVQAMSGSRADVQAFVNGGWQSSWDADERLRVYRTSESSGATVKAAAAAALNGGTAAIDQFLSTGLESAQLADDRLAATRMLTGGPNSSGPVLNAAAADALAGSSEQLREFLAYGQRVARARDQELASIGSLTEQAKQAGDLAARETLAATQASTRAVNAAAEAKKAAEKAAEESRLAGGSAAKASAAAGRAADAAKGAADAARDAIGASNAAQRAARIASDAARKATAAASLTAQAASRAQQAAAAARTDAGKASAARQAAEAARDAARSIRELDQVKAERDRALAEAEQAAGAAKSASGNADAAAAAAEEAAGHSGVSAAEAARARKAAERARQQAAIAARAADRALKLARAAAKASDEAFTFAAQAATHAERAAAAAIEAADAAGRAETAAVESTRHAAAAVEAANTAVAASNKAIELEALARQEDIDRLDEATAQGVLAAREAAATEAEAKAAGGEIAAWNRKLTRDTAEEDRVDAGTRQLLDEAAASTATTEVVLDRGRRAAAALVVTGGDWTKLQAQEALAGDETQLRAWLTDGRLRAVGQDDRARVWLLVDTLPDGPEKTAAKNALNGADAAVATFLRTRSYSGKVATDRRAIYSILAAPGIGPNLTNAANAALGGSGADMHRFLTVGQHSARTADERLEVYRTMESGGAEVKAAGTVALAGPPSYISYFLTAGRYQAAQRDAEQAAHVAKVHALIQESQGYAERAVADSAEANRVAAVARKASAEATTWANKATASAQKATEYANQARQSAAQAKASADQAAQSAATARNAANTAQKAAEDAARSATVATSASRRAAAAAANAAEYASEARESAKAAGQDARAAESAAKEASDIYDTKLKEFEEAQRNAAAGSGPGGTGTALENHKGWNCLSDASAISKECLSVYKDFAGALIDPAKCSTPANSGTSGCAMLSELKQFVDQNPDLIMDMLQLVLGMCGLIPGVGEACDAVDAAISFKRGDWVGGLLSVGASVPVIGWLGSAAKGLKNSDKLRNIKNIVQKLIKGGCPNSFAADTEVLLADGGRKPIDRIRPADRVLATDPLTGRTGGRPVAGVIVGSGLKSLVDVTVDGDHGGTVTATAEHPFWLAKERVWADAEVLQPGQWLRTSAGTWAQIDAVEARSAEQRVYNLSVADFRTFYVVAGDTPVLVHNCPTGEDLAKTYRDNANNGVGAKRNVAVTQYELNGTKGTDYNVSGEHRNPGTIKKPTSRQFTGANNYRPWDSETVILENYASQLTPTSTGKIDLYTEMKPCTGCGNVIDQFRTKFPNVELNVKWTWETVDDMIAAKKPNPPQP